MVKIGDLTEVFTKTLIIHENKDVWIEFDLGNWKVKVKIVHKKDEASGPGITLEGKGDHAEIGFNKFDHPLGVATTQPIQIGFTDTKQPIFLTAAETLIGGSIRRMDVQFLLGGAQ